MKAQFAEKLQQAVQQQMGTNARMEVNVEQHPQFKEEWRKALVSLDKQYIQNLTEYKHALLALN